MPRPEVPLGHAFDVDGCGWLSWTIVAMWKWWILLKIQPGEIPARWMWSEIDEHIFSCQATLIHWAMFTKLLKGFCGIDNSWCSHQPTSHAWCCFCVMLFVLKTKWLWPVTFRPGLSCHILQRRFARSYTATLQHDRFTRFRLVASENGNPESPSRAPPCIFNHLHLPFLFVNCWSRVHARNTRQKSQRVTQPHIASTSTCLRLLERIPEFGAAKSSHCVYLLY